MNKLVYLFFLLPIVACNVSPCGFSKDQFLKDYHSFVDKVKKEENSFSDKEWEDYDSKFSKMVEDCYKQYEDEMSDDEKVEFWKDVVTYSYNRYGLGLMKELANSDTRNRVLQNLKEYMKENNNFEDELDIDINIKGNLDKFFNKLLDAAEDFGEGLEKALDEIEVEIDEN